MANLKDLISKTAPALGVALGGPLGGAVVSILAEVFATKPTEDSVAEVIQHADPSVVAASLARAEAMYKAAAEESITLRSQIDQHAELVRLDYQRGVLYSGWRPLGGWIAVLYSGGFCALAMWQAYFGVYTLLTMAPQVLMIGGPIMAIAGIYVWGRSEERKAVINAGTAQPGLVDALGNVVKSLRR